MNPDIESAPSVEAYFGEHLAGAMESLRLQAQPDTEGYLVGLLAGYAVSDAMPDPAEPLVLRLQQALAVSGPERAACLRALGDSALFACGFFPDSFERRGLDPAYAASMGGRAYLYAGSADRNRGRRRVLAELAQRFRDFVRVLGEVRERTAMTGDEALVALYERWCASRSPALAHRLRRRGVLPVPPGRGGAAS